jgi:hypothetical protein
MEIGAGAETAAVLDKARVTSFQLNPLVARWLRVEAPANDQVAPVDWDVWLLQRMSRGEIVDVGGVLVDRAVLRQRFACVAGRCAPGPGRGNCRSCCADAFVSLTRAEDRRLGRHRNLLGWLKRREPRLESSRGRAFYRDGREPGLARPDGRCVFSQLDKHGRIRCHLHAYAKHTKIDRGELQPISCRLFPLIVIDRGDGRVVLSVVASHTRRLVSTYPPSRYPCLADASLPPLHQAMRADLDWLFGKGFARALAALDSDGT